MSMSSLVKALVLITVISEREPGGMTLSAAARRAGIHVSTAHRLLNALVQQSFLSFNPYTKRYHLGIMPYEIVARAGTDLKFFKLRKKLRASLERAQVEANGIVCLSVISRGEALCVDVVEGQSNVRINNLKVGSRRPLGAGAPSLAMLASLEEAEREVIIRRETDRYLKYGTLTADVVRVACEALPRQGYVLDDARIVSDIGAVGIPVFSPDEPLCAVSVSKGISRLSSERRQIALMLSNAVREVGFQTIEIP